MCTLPETNMETQKGPYEDYSPFKKGTIWISMLVWGNVYIYIYVYRYMCIYIYISMASGGV